jgi:hypothetical protein
LFAPAKVSIIAPAAANSLLSPANPLKAFASPENAAKRASAVSVVDFSLFLLPSTSTA